VEATDLVAHLLAQVGVEVGERLVQQEHGRLHHDGAREGHPLLLAARQLCRVPVGELTQAHHVEDAGHARAHLVAREAAHLEAEGHVLGHRHVRPDGVALEDHRHGAFLGRERGRRRRDDAAVHLDRALAGRQEARDHPERGGLAAPRGPEQREELAGRQGCSPAPPPRDRSDG
jgi:hypothetical protein